MRRTPDVLVIGGGVIGLAIARAIAPTRRSVLVVERGAFGGEASGAAAGVLAVASGTEMDGPRLALRQASLSRFAPLVAELYAETGIDVEYDTHGVVELCLEPPDEAYSAERAEKRRAQGFRAELLDAAALHGAEPEATPAARAGVLFPDDTRLEPARFIEALVASARRRGVELEPGADVREAERDGERITRVCVAGEWVSPGSIVLAAGAWSARVAGIVPALAVRPARGQMLALRPRTPLCRRVLSYADGYVVPCRNGEVLVGATVEDVGFDKAVTPAGMSALLAKVARLLPRAAEAPLTRLWAGLRPYAPDPIIGPAPGLRNVLLACGHHRNGILLAPITAEIIAATLDGGPPPAGLPPA